MALQSIINSDLFVSGALTSKTFTPPAGSITDASVIAAANIAATKLIHQFPITYRAAGTVATATTIVHQHKAAAAIAQVSVMAGTTPTSSDTVTVDIKKAPSGSSTFATILSSTVVLNSSSVACIPQTATITGTTSAAGDTLEIVVTVSGTSAQNLLVTIWTQEQAQ